MLLCSAPFLVSLLLQAAHVLAGPTGDRLVIGEETYELDMRANISFERSDTFTTYKDMLLIPAKKEPMIGIWKIGQYRAALAEVAKTHCKYTRVQGYYLPGNNREMRTGMTVAQCKAACCAESWCKSFDYALKATTDHGTQTCWLSGFREGSAGLGYQPGSYDYYEIDDGEELLTLQVMSSYATAADALVIGTARHSGNIYQYKLTGTSLSTLGQYAPPSASAAHASHSKPVLSAQIASWSGGERLITGSYDKQVIVWKIGSSGLEIESRITGFLWPVWAVQPADARDIGIFVAGDQANITRWIPTAPGSATFKKAQVLFQHFRLVRALAYTKNNGGILASGSEDNRIVLWRKGADNNFNFGSRFFDHIDAVTKLHFYTPAAGNLELLFSGSDDGNVMVFNPAPTNASCAFERVENYYLPGNNRYEFQNTPLDECKKICCESPWCQSFDFAREADPSGQHPANTCWMSTLIEGASGLKWDSTGTYDYYEIKKKGTRMLTLKQPGPVLHFSYAPSPNDLLAIERAGTTDQPGGFILTKIIEVMCQDGWAPNYAGTECLPCPLGSAGRGGSCDECPPGQFAPKEGSFECSPCPRGFASSITETPRNEMLPFLSGLVKCTQCPHWALSRESGLAFCEWCPTGSMPDENGRQVCLTIRKGYRNSNWGESWGRDGDEKSDAFCPQANHSPVTGCFYDSYTFSNQWCPMTCPRNMQKHVDKYWNSPPRICCSDRHCYPCYPPTRWVCAIQDRAVQEQCNKLMCMGAMVSMQNSMKIAEGQCDKDGRITDCTCDESMRQSCVGGLKRLREKQCSDQCNWRWCNMMCEDAAAREYTGIFRADSVENRFSLMKCESRGEICSATCQNQQRRVVVNQRCGEWSIRRKGGPQVINDFLCGGYYGPDNTCKAGRNDDWSLYRPAACGASIISMAAFYLWIAGALGFCF
eukprot:TRINITY_DN32144_c0_g1_i1.p1 TRINITY_DN32144_c0_g1~~TRINITY_DN32144_c0_g1_i1.p1  ORF type:complete len:936 (+),score=133.33 TRINITY_DN32144_c0_g1_i1:147-2954(+)